MVQASGLQARSRPAGDEAEALRRRHRGLTVEDSVAFRALGLSERRMYDLIKGGETRTYNQLELEGVRRKSISPGIRAMEALGLIEAERKPFDARTQRYDINVYRLAQG
jgi:hypothetical protein